MIQQIFFLDRFLPTKFYKYSTYKNSNLSSKGFYKADFIPNKIISFNDYQSLKTTDSISAPHVARVELDFLISDPEQIHELLSVSNKKNIFIGSFDSFGIDIHNSYRGPSSGALLILSSYYTLVTGQNAFNILLYSLLFLVFFFAFLLAFYYDSINLGLKASTIQLKKIRANFVEKKNLLSYILVLLVDAILHFFPTVVIFLTPLIVETNFDTHIRLFSLYYYLIMVLIVAKIYGNYKTPPTIQLNESEFNQLYKEAKDEAKKEFINNEQEKIA
ncbi:MAG: hypothetical protein IPJ79_10135 [Bacteroidetes bacterium]|nr:hypothetical protein [Bacteroidota bacterium]